VPTKAVTSATSTKVTSTAAAPAVTSTAAGTVARWGQCGGTGYTGATACVSGTTCTKQNDYYSQCL
jgi:hypothetical protein